MISLLDRLENISEPWLHESGDVLIGEVVDIDSRESEYGRYQIVVVETEKGSTEQGGKAIPIGSERAFHAMRTVPRNEIAKQKPKIGERLGVKFHGTAPRGDYAAYKIRVERQSPPLDDEAGVVDIRAAAAVPDPGESDEQAPAAADDIPF
jgi:hypothetical protein